MIKEQIQQLSKNIFNDVVANRRHLHSHPELSFHEVETSAFRGKQTLRAWAAISKNG